MSWLTNRILVVDDEVEVQLLLCPLNFSKVEQTCVLHIEDRDIAGKREDQPLCKERIY